MNKQELIRKIYSNTNKDIPIIYEICKFGRADYRHEEGVGTAWYTQYADGEPEMRTFIHCFKKQFANPRELAKRLSDDEAEQKRIDGYFIDR